MNVTFIGNGEAHATGPAQPARVSRAGKAPLYLAWNLGNARAAEVVSGAYPHRGALSVQRALFVVPSARPHRGGRDMSEVVVTGAAGFIGSHLCDRLVRDGWRVRGVDALTHSYDPQQKRRNLDGLQGHPDFALVHTDLAENDSAALLDGAVAVVHLAAEPGVPGSWGTGFDRYVDRNVRATQRLLEGVVHAEVPRVVYASSSSVYGNAVAAVPESAPLHPASPYGATKLLGELLLRTYAEQHRFHDVALRYFSVYGPRQRPDMAAHRFIEALLDGRPPQVYGDGSQTRDFTYVDDVVTATVAAIEADLPTHTVMNLAAGLPVSVAQLLELLGELLDVPLLDVEVVPERRGDVPWTEGDISIARRLLGWTPRVGLREGLLRQIAWHRALRTNAAANRVGVGTAATSVAVTTA